MPTADGAIRVPVQRRIIVRVQIDRPRSDDQSRGIQHLFGIAALQAANLGNLAVLDPQVGVVRRHQSPIDNHASLNNHIELCHKVLLYRKKIGEMEKRGNGEMEKGETAHSEEVLSSSPFPHLPVSPFAQSYPSMPYTRVAVSCTILRRSLSERLLNVLLMNSCERGQVAAVCG